MCCFVVSSASRTRPSEVPSRPTDLWPFAAPWVCRGIKSIRHALEIRIVAPTASNAHLVQPQVSLSSQTVCVHVFCIYMYRSNILITRQMPNCYNHSRSLWPSQWASESFLPCSKMVIYLVQLALFVSLEAFETKTLFVFSAQSTRETCLSCLL